jgi:hypothetical protein
MEQTETQSTPDPQARSRTQDSTQPRPDESAAPAGSDTTPLPADDTGFEPV